MRPLLLRLAAFAFAIAAIGCPSEERRTFVLTRVVPEIDPSCGAPSDARYTMVTALGDFPAGNTITYINGSDAEFSIDTFPPETTALEVSVIAASGEVLAVGRTREFDVEELEDQAELPVFMAGRKGFCPTGSMADFRASPLVARAGVGVLVAGGSGAPAVFTAEWYDPDRGQFLPVAGSAPYGADTHGLRGASMTELSDGRVAIVGGNSPGYQLYDPVDGSLGAARLLNTVRGFHAAVALPDDRVALIGGCTQFLVSGQCDLGSATRLSEILDVETGELEDGPRLGSARVGASAYLEPSGTVLVFGGVDADGNPARGVERIDPVGGAPAETIPGVDGALASLISGGVLVGYTPDADPASAWVVPPGGTQGSPVADGPAPRSGATFTALEDGKVLVFGGSAAPGGEDTEVVPGALYLPFPESFDQLDPVPLPSALLPSRTEHAAVRLDDGSVLILGGTSDGLALNDAWIYRHDLTGPLTPAIEISVGPGTRRQAEFLSPRDPTRAGWVPTHYRVEGSGAADGTVSEWVIAAGPRFLDPRITTRLGATSGGVALMLAYENPASYYYVELLEGQPVRLLRVTPATDAAQVVCSGDPLPADALEVVDEAPMFQAQAGADSFGVWREGVQLLDCELDDPIGRGYVGVGVLGGEGAVIVIDDIAAYR